MHKVAAAAANGGSGGGSGVGNSVNLATTTARGKRKKEYEEGEPEEGGKRKKEDAGDEDGVGGATDEPSRSLVALDDGAGDRVELGGEPGLEKTGRGRRVGVGQGNVGQALVGRAWAAGSVLLGGGREAGTPVAVVTEGTMPTEHTVLTTLGELAGAIAAQGVRPPAVIVIGDVVAVAHPDSYPQRLP